MEIKLISFSFSFSFSSSSSFLLFWFILNIITPIKSANNKIRHIKTNFMISFVDKYSLFGSLYMYSIGLVSLSFKSLILGFFSVFEFFWFIHSGIKFNKYPI